MLVYMPMMANEAYFRDQATRYSRIARAKSDPEMAARLEAMAREFLAKAETAAATAAAAEVAPAVIP
jgi:hypothetical protein